ncbi:GntR family transcriptional regulator [Paenibacillus filicis]|uniref:GntR family transcriptional regulator n=1 Tax=Paenibacillus filicis TaxID=669464 RepID=A0ABU9DS09_9BACL
MKDKQLNRYVLTDELYALLKQQILVHTMQAGDKINIDRLARDLGVSNIPIRESLSRLASEGFVTIVPFKGMFVAGMSLADIDEIFEIRSQLENLAIRKAVPHIPSTELEVILEDLNRGEEAVEKNEEVRISRMNHDLHGTILRYAGNENLRQMVTSIIERIHRYLNYVHYNIEMGAEKVEHEGIVRALLDRDTEKAAEAMRLHIDKAHQRLRAHFDK